MRIVADTNIVISGLLWHGNPRRILDAARDGIIELYTSPALLDELAEVLGRDKFAPRLEAADASVQQLTEDYAALATVIDPIAIEPMIIRDPDDDAVLACAISAECEYIVSGDDDLLNLKRHGGINILTVIDFLSELHL